MTTPAYVELRAPIGGAWTRVITVDQPNDWTGWTGRAQVRRYRGAPDVDIELTVDLTVPEQVTVTIPDGATDALTSYEGWWDVYVNPPEPANPQYIAWGPAWITGRVTVPA